MATPKREIGISLSGGGIRATIFHLGVLKWLAENNLLQNISRISTVSGASLCVGLVFSHSGGKWPTSEEYLNTVLPRIQQIFLEKDIQKIALQKLIMSPSWWNKKVNLMAKMMSKHWGVSGKISELDEKPKWYINCTTYETGKRFRFTQANMGDYQIGYVAKPDIPVADAICSSAGFPVLIGPYKMDTTLYTWQQSDYSKNPFQKPEQYIHLWDGGVYDNLGLESVFKPDNGGTLSDGIDYLIVSNASGGLGYERRKSELSGKNLKRMLDISMDQVSALRNRSVMNFIKRTGNGMYLNIGNSAEFIAESAGVPPAIKSQLMTECMPDSEALKVQHYPTTLSKPSKFDFELILRHGYEVAKCTDICYKAHALTSLG